jgi:hypothetical protein
MERKLKDAVTEKNGRRWTAEMEELLNDWHRRAYAAQCAYYELAERFRKLHYKLGIWTVILTSAAGATIFVDKEKVPEKLTTYLPLGAGIVSLLAAVLAGLQTFLRPGQAATEYGFAADWYAAIRREIEQLQALPEGMRGEPKACLDSLRKEMNKASQKSPELGETHWRQAAQRFAIKEPPPK